MQYFETSDTFLEFLKRRISMIGDTPNSRLDALIGSIYKQRVLRYAQYHLSLAREASIVIYLDARDTFLSIKNSLIDTLARDMMDITADASLIYDISQILERYSDHLEKVTSALVEMMPMDVFEARTFPDPDLYREALFEENSWIEGEAESMRIIISKWMSIHKDEVQNEKAKLNLITQENKLSDIIRLIQTTGSILDESTEKVMRTL